jgi:hypothetical protein
VEDDQAAFVDDIQSADNLLVNSFSGVITIEEYEIKYLVVSREKMP